MANINKNIGNLAFVVIVFAAIGCSCPNLRNLGGRSNSTESSPNATPISLPTTPAKSGEYDISLAKFKQIKVGAKRSDVEALLGGKGTELSSTEAGRSTFSTNKWTGEGYTSIILVFKNDKVLSKSQVGLK